MPDSDKLKLGEEHDELMKGEFDEISEREELMESISQKITTLKGQYKEYMTHKPELAEFAKAGERDVERAREDSYKEIEAKTAGKTLPALGFTVNWNPLNEMVTRQLAGFRKQMPMSNQEAKQWFYIIRREEIKFKKAKQILYRCQRDMTTR